MSERLSQLARFAREAREARVAEASLREEVDRAYRIVSDLRDQLFGIRKWLMEFSPGHGSNCHTHDFAAGQRRMAKDTLSRLDELKEDPARD